MTDELRMMKNVRVSLAVNDSVEWTLYPADVGIKTEAIGDHIVRTVTIITQKSMARVTPLPLGSSK